MVNNHQRADVTRNVLAMAGMEDSISAEDMHVHKEGKPVRMKKDEEAVQSVQKVILGWKNLFGVTEDEPMSNISSGLVASQQVSNDMLSAYRHGESRLQQFIKDRLLTCTVQFHDPLPSLKLKTFGELTKTKSVNVKGKDVVVHADRGFFARLLVLAQSRSMDLRRVF